MGYNQDLEARIDRLTDRLGDITRKRMFGGIGYLIRGNMCFGIHQESLVLRVSPDKAEELLRSEYVSVFDITGKPMKGWVLISPDMVEDDDELLGMLKLGADFAGNLPGK